MLVDYLLLYLMFISTSAMPDPGVNHTIDASINVKTPSGIGSENISEVEDLDLAAACPGQFFQDRHLCKRADGTACENDADALDFTKRARGNPAPTIPSNTVFKEPNAYNIVPYRYDSQTPDVEVDSCLTDKPVVAWECKHDAAGYWNECNQIKHNEDRNTVCSARTALANGHLYYKDTTCWSGVCPHPAFTATHECKIRKKGIVSCNTDVDALEFVKGLNYPYNIPSVVLAKKITEIFVFAYEITPGAGINPAAGPTISYIRTSPTSGSSATSCQIHPGKFVKTWKCVHDKEGNWNACSRHPDANTECNVRSSFGDGRILLPMSCKKLPGDP